MYEAFYGLQERPFDLTPDPRFLFMTAGHREALTTIQYGISGRKGMTLLVGGAGTGKSTLVQAALRSQEGLNVEAIHLANPSLTRREFFQFLAWELGLSDAAASSKTHFLRELNATLLERHAAGRVTALVIDEAQVLSDALLEEVRLLSNAETSTEKLLPVVLIGQPELAARLNQASLRQLKQRVALRATLAPLKLRETADYMAERIRVAGGDIRSVFAPEAIAAIFACSGGIPRTISVVCDNAMVSGFALDQRPIGRAVIAEVCRDFDLPAPQGPSKVAPVVAPTPPTATSALVLHSAVGTLPQATPTPGPPASDDRIAPPAPPVVETAETRWAFRSLFSRTGTR